jgi:murein DD-endopeptidase MepM/ murein hydrolase activator NlpD
LFQKNDFGHLQGGAGATALLGTGLGAGGFGSRTLPAPSRSAGDWRERIKYWAEDVNLVPDLGQHLFSIDWFRGLATCFSLCFIALKLTPDFQALPAPTEAVASQATYDEIRSQMVMPLALGADSGRHMASTDAVSSLNSTPERPMVTLSAAIGEGDSFAHALSRAGVSSNDIGIVTGLVGSDFRSGSLTPGTRLNITLGRRESRNVPRPLDALSFRARLDLGIEIKRVSGALDITRIPIRIDATPLRIRGVVTDSLYRAARAAGAPPAAIQTYLRVLAQQISLESIGPGDRFDIILANRRAETGENEVGDLLYAGVQLVGGRKLDMLKWTKDGQSQWFEASGVGEQRGVLGSPVSGHLTSSFGMRFHPILGYSRMHAGVDFGAPYGAPIYAVTDGIVAYAGRHGGHGNFVKLQHSGGLGTGYAHMSRIATYAGAHVRRGQVIGYVGSTGLSTGPHLHYEVYRNGETVNPMSVKFMQTSQLSGSELAAFRARLTQLKALVPGGAGMPAGPSTVVVPKSLIAAR